jgi:hypothetical protein
MNRCSLMLVVLLAAGASCGPHPRSAPQRDLRVGAASLFTRRYSQSRLSGWNVRATAAGGDCGVLLVETSVLMEDSMVEALHYGAGAYGVVDGGVQRFSRDRSFRAVAYKDSSGRVWTYGDVTAGDAEKLTRCR